MNKLIFITRATKESGKGHFLRVLRMASELSVYRDCIIVSDHSDKVNPSKDFKFITLKLDNLESLIEQLHISSKDIIWFDIPDSQRHLIVKFVELDIPIVSMNMFAKSESKRLEDIAIYPVFDVMKKEYSRDKTTVQLSGSEFISTPDMFFNHTFHSDETVLVTMGGTDPMNFTSKVLRAISDMGSSSFLFKVILPSGLQKKDFSKGFHNIEHLVLFNFGELDFVHELKKARYAIINGGMTRYECVVSKTYFIALSIHEKQVNLTEKVTQYGYGYNFGIFDEKNITELTQYLEILPEENLLQNNTSNGFIPSLKRNSAAWIYKKVLLELNYED